MSKRLAALYRPGSAEFELRPRVPRFELNEADELRYQVSTKLRVSEQWLARV